MSYQPLAPFNRGVVSPVETLKAGYERVKPDYWLFVGMCAVAMIIGQAVPMGILMGPMMCGLYLSFFSKRRGLPIEFGPLFKGFDYFGQSVVASILHVVPMIAIIIPAYFIGYLGTIGVFLALGADNSGIASVLMFILLILFWLLVVALLLGVSIGFSFAYPLSVDAVKLSFKAAFANFWGLLGMAVLSALLSLVGVMLCYVGVLLVFPITLGAVAMAYEQVFGLSNAADRMSNMPPPPPSF